MRDAVGKLGIVVGIGIALSFYQAYGKASPLLKPLFPFAYLSICFSMGFCAQQFSCRTLLSETSTFAMSQHLQGAF
jgi:hypothetical protein